MKEIRSRKKSVIPTGPTSAQPAHRARRRAARLQQPSPLARFPIFPLSFLNF
jgi:hypothetical protein